MARSKRVNPRTFYSPPEGHARPFFVPWRQRQKRMRELEEAVWDETQNEQGDPGLRNVYRTIGRAPIEIVTCPLKKDVNHGGLLRLAEAYRLEHVWLNPEVDGAVDTSGSRGSRDLQPHTWSLVEDSVKAVKAKGCKLYGLTLAEDAVPLDAVNWEFPCALILGAELEGLPEEIGEQCDVRVGIPLFGLVTSLNVATAAGIVVNAAITAYAKQNPEFRPVRRESRGLMGLGPANYREG